MFLRKRKYEGRIKNLKYRGWCKRDTVQYQICESYRDEQGRPRQRVICSLKLYEGGLYAGPHAGATGGLREHAAWMRTPSPWPMTSEQVEYVEHKAKALEFIAEKYGNRPWDTA